MWACDAWCVCGVVRCICNYFPSWSGAILITPTTTLNVTLGDRRQATRLDDDRSTFHRVLLILSSRSVQTLVAQADLSCILSRQTKHFRTLKINRFYTENTRARAPPRPIQCVFGTFTLIVTLISHAPSIALLIHSSLHARFSIMMLTMAIDKSFRVCRAMLPVFFGLQFLRT